MQSTTMYVIQIVGTLDEATASWFEGLTIRQISETATILITPPIDQTALHGILTMLRDLAIPLTSVYRYDSTEEGNTAVNN